MSYDDLGQTVGASCSPKKFVLDLISSTTSWPIITFVTRLGAVDRNSFAARTVARAAVTATSSTPHGSIRCGMICLCYKSDSGLSPGTLAHLRTNISHHGSANRSVASLTAIPGESDIGSCLFRDTSEVVFPMQLVVHLYLLSTCSSLISVSGSHHMPFQRYTPHETVATSSTSSANTWLAMAAFRTSKAPSYIP
jgi:hypothetical protein